jgi:taurine dioxygenase
MERSEGEAMLADLEAHATHPDLIYRHKWQVDDVLMWDNRCTMHCVEPYDAAKEKRSVHRVVVKGDNPY